MSAGPRILIVGGYGEVGRRLAPLLTTAGPGTVAVAGRNPERAGGVESRRIDVDDPNTIEAALDGIDVVVACVRQQEPHLLHAAIRRGVAYTSIAPPWLPWPELQRVHAQAQRSGARIVAAAGLEPGISSVLARIAADRLGGADAIETALLLGVGDAYGADSMEFLVEEIAQSFDVLVDGALRPMHAFGSSASVIFPDPIGRRRAYAIPFRDQLYYPHTLGVRTAIARIALDPPWLGSLLSALVHLGAPAWIRRGAARRRIDRLTNALRRRYAGADRFALCVEARRGSHSVRATLEGRGQAQATAVGVAAIATALAAGEVDEPGVWLTEQVIDPQRFLVRLAEAGLVPIVEARTTLAHGKPGTTEAAMW